MKKILAKRLLLPRLVVSFVLFILISALTISLPACEQEAPPEFEIPAHFTTYTDEESLFSISYPSNWETALSVIEEAVQSAKDLLKSIESDLPMERVSILFLAGIPSETGTGYFPSVTIGVEPIPEIVGGHDEVVEAGIRGVKQVLPDYREFSRVKTTVDGRTATILAWQGTYPPPVGKLRNLQMFVLVGKTFWVVSCSDYPENYGRYEDDFNAIVRSLRIFK